MSVAASRYRKRHFGSAPLAKKLLPFSKRPRSGHQMNPPLKWDQDQWHAGHPMIRARWNIFRGLRAWRSANYRKCVARLYAGVAERELAGRLVSPSLRLKLLMASALTGNSDIARSQLIPIEAAILHDSTKSDHDKNYLLLVVEAACQRLALPVPEGAAMATRTVYPHVTNRLIETYPIHLLLPERRES
jgi:hypothetical protein